MPDMLQLLRLADGAVAMLPEVDALARLAVHWREIARELWRKGQDTELDTPEKFVALLSQSIATPAVADVFGDLGLAALHTDLAAIADKLNDPATPWGALLSPVSQFGENYLGTTGGSGGYDPGDGTAAFALALPALSGQAAAQSGDMGFSLAGSASARLQIEPGALWPFPKDGVAPGLLRIAAVGTLMAKAGVSVPFPSVGKAGIDGGASSDAELSLFFRPASADTSVARALLTALPNLPDPFDLNSLRHCMALANLEGLVMSFDGRASAAFSLALGKDFAIPDIVSGKLAITAGLTYERQATWLVSLCRQQGGALRFVVSRERLKTAQWAVGAGLELDPSPLVARLHDELDRASGSWGKRLDAIRPYLSPGIMLRGVLKNELARAAGKLVADEGLRAALVADAGLAIDPAGGGGDSGLAEWLEGRIADAFSAGEKAILDNAEVAAKGVAARLSERLPPLAGEPLRSAVEAEVTTLADLAKAAFERQLEALVPDEDAGKKVNAELQAIGVRLDAGLDTVARAAKGVSDLMEGFDATLRKLVAATADAAKYKLAARIGWDGANRSGSQYEAMGSFTADSAEARALWRDVATGRFAAIQDMFGRPAVPGVLLDPASSISATSSSQAGFAAEVVLLDVTLSVQDIVSASATITCTADGNVTAKGEGTASHEVRLFGESRKASFASMWDLLRRKGDSRASGSIAVSLQLDHDDDDITPDEMKGLFSGCAGLGLIDAKRIETAEGIYQGWRQAAAAGGRKPQGRVSLRMTLPPLAIDRMLKLGRRLRSGGDPALARHLFGAAVSAMITTCYRSEKLVLSDAADARRDFAGMQGIGDPAEIMFRLRDSQSTLLHIDDDISYYHAFHATYPAFLPMIRRANAFGRMIDLMSQIVDAVPRDAAPDVKWAWSTDQYRQVGGLLAAASSQWLEVNARAFAIRDALSPLLLAFVDLLARFANPATPAAGPEFVLDSPADPAWASPLFTLSMTPRGGEPVPIP